MGETVAQDCSVQYAKNRDRERRIRRVEPADLASRAVAAIRRRTSPLCSPSPGLRR